MGSCLTGGPGERSWLLGATGHHPLQELDADVTSAKELRPLATESLSGRGGLLEEAADHWVLWTLGIATL